MAILRMYTVGVMNRPAGDGHGLPNRYSDV